MIEHNGWTRDAVIEFVTDFQNRNQRQVQRSDFRYLPGFPRPADLTALFGGWREFRKIRPSVGPRPARPAAPPKPVRNVINLRPRRVRIAKGYVDPEPFVKWLEAEVTIRGTSEVARRIDATEELVRQYLDGAFQAIRLDTVDRALIEYGETDLLNVLYPIDLPLALVA